MIDHLRLRLYFKEQYLKRCSHEQLGQGQGKGYLAVKLTELGLTTIGSTYRLDENGDYQIEKLYAPYDKLESSFSTMAFKLFEDGGFGDPCVELKASPAKLMQGHNVYGVDDIELCAKSLIGLFYKVFPTLKGYLNPYRIEVGHIDITYSSKVSHENIVPDVIDYLSRIRNGQVKPTVDARYQNTCYFGAKDSKLQQLKCYGKYFEMLNQLKGAKKQAEKGCYFSQVIVNTYTDELINFARRLLRWELRIKAEKLKRLGIPTRLCDLIAYQKKNPNMLSELWQQSFNPIFEALKGEAMPYATDEEVFDMLKAKLVTRTKKGKVSYSKAQSAMRLYESINHHGYLRAKERYTKTSFYRNFKYLLDCGISKAWLQNMHVSQRRTIPIINFTHIDFVNQYPSDFVVPQDEYPQLNLLVS